MKRLLVGLGLAAFVFVGFSASFKTNNWIETSGTQLPRAFVNSIKPAAPKPSTNPFGVLAPRHAEAALPGFRWVFDQVNWRTHRDGSFVDSTIVTVSNTDFSSDTTAAYPLERVYFPSDGGVTTAVQDSLFALVFCVGGGTAAPTIDSVYVGMQVSIDGFSWVSTTVTGGPAGTFLADAFVTGKPPIASAGAIESSSSNQVCLEYNVTLPAINKYTMGGSGSTAPTDQQWFGWRYARWIVTWSLVDETDVLSAWVGHFTPVGAPGGY